MSGKIFNETLESRLLFSATSDAVLSAAVKTDRTQIQVDLLKFRADCFASSSTMLADILKIQHDDKTQLTTLAPSVQKFRSDLVAMREQLLADRLTEAQNVVSDELTILKDKLAALKDRGTTAATTDRATLLADRIKLQNDLVSGLNARIETRQMDYTTIFNDAQAIVAAAQNQPGLTADVTKWANDRTTCINTLTADLTALAADRTQFVADLTAQQSA
ncbi:MAG TPA: hypothetical protein VFE47_10740 [Tepidisphaeraceae bacterium]|jgi:hypothetical protein|nr:hypothetical protein [Tepidisphaeraceae bacterium]